MSPNRLYVARAILHVFVYPPLAVGIFYLAMVAGMAVAFSNILSDWPPLLAIVAVIGAVAIGGTVSALPLILLGAFATGRNRPAMIPVGITVLLLAGLLGAYLIPGLNRVLEPGDLISHLMFLGGTFLAMAGIFYLWGIWRLLHCPGAPWRLARAQG